MDAIPQPLRALPWIGWRAERDSRGKIRKNPYQIGFLSELASNHEGDEAARAPIGTQQTSSRNADPEVKHWRNEGDVREILAMAPELFDGFGVVLTERAGITFVDLDDVVDPDTGTIAPWAQQMVDTMNSWTEYSVSGTGLHIFCLGRLPGSGRVGYLDGDATRRIEVYSRGRFAYLTGHVLAPERPLANRQALITRLAQYVGPIGSTSQLSRVGMRTSLPSRTWTRSDAPILAGQRNDALFRVARSLVLHGLRGDALAQALVAVSHQRCVPVPADADVIKIARHAERLPDRPRV
jgi:hypothetical protein